MRGKPKKGVLRPLKSYSFQDTFIKFLEHTLAQRRGENATLFDTSEVPVYIVRRDFLMALGMLVSQTSFSK